MFEITIKTLDGKSKCFQLENDEILVSAFKAMLATEMDIPAESQRIIFQGKVLADDRKLKECGVDGKTIHLVPRPPPRANSPPASSSTAHSAEPIPTPLEDLSHAAESLTQGLISNLTNMGIASDSIVRNDNSGAVDISLSLPFREMRERQFQRMRHRAIVILDSLDVIPRPVVPQSGSTYPFESSGDLVAEMRSGGTTRLQQLQRSSQVGLRRLVEMMAELRVVWQRMQPHLDRWQASLMSEHRLSQVRLAEWSDSEEIAWDSRFFDQVSDLLHTNAHMLHLLSDFSVGNPNLPHHYRTDDSYVRTNRPVFRTATSISERCERGSATTSTSSPAVMDTTDAAASRDTYHYLQCPEEVNLPALHAHINIESTVSAVGGRRHLSSGSLRRRSRSVNVMTGYDGWHRLVPTTQLPRSESEFHLPQSFTRHRRRARSQTYVAMPRSVDAAAHNQPSTNDSEPHSNNHDRNVIQSVTGARAEQQTSPSTEQQQQADARVSSTTTSGAPILRVVNTSSSGSTSSRPETLSYSSAPVHPVLPHVVMNIPAISGMAGVDRFDPFLHCNSRHLLDRRGQMSRSSDSNTDSTRMSQSPLGMNTTTADSIWHTTTMGGTTSTLTTPDFNQLGNRISQAIASQLHSLLGGLTPGANAEGSGAVTGPFAFVVNHPHGGGVQYIPADRDNSTVVLPPILTPSGTNSGLSGNTQLTRLPSAIMDGVLRTVWTFINNLARTQLPAERALFPSANVECRMGAGVACQPVAVATTTTCIA